MKRKAAAVAAVLALNCTPAAAATDPVLSNDTGLYPRVIRLQDGRVLASVVTFAGTADGLGAIYESVDDGTSFARIGTVTDPEAADGQGLCCATLFELPRQIGAMPAGTLLIQHWTCNNLQRQIWHLQPADLRSPPVKC